MPQRRRWILELHLRDKHPGVSPDSLLGPSPMALGRAKRARRSAEESDTSAAAGPKPPKSSRGKTTPRECNEKEEEVEKEKAGAEGGEEDPDNNTDTINHTESRPAVSVRLKLEPSTDFVPPLVGGDDTHQTVDPPGPLPGPQGSALSPSGGAILPPAGD
ncbi:unnamed protein product [Dibothriocephalus latus]|uniref:Uncharacterized protein n=1 Tax=Dibothriocephalus latus TaxID=60516 RepID=A0A3P6QMD6_DIBLA|nr:unnamed protein product [Dibothriocephalus latus]